MQNKTNQGQKVVSPVLIRVAKWVIFVLNRVGVWGPRRDTSTQTSLECPLPPPPLESCNSQEIDFEVLLYFWPARSTLCLFW